VCIRRSTKRLLSRYLRRILASYAAYYNELRRHLALDKDSPGSGPILMTYRIFRT
jgi:hypothetical protein